MCVCVCAHFRPKVVMAAWFGDVISGRLAMTAVLFLSYARWCCLPFLCASLSSSHSSSPLSWSTQAWSYIHGFTECHRTPSSGRVLTARAPPHHSPPFAFEADTLQLWMRQLSFTPARILLTATQHALGFFVCGCWDRLSCFQGESLQHCRGD